MNTFADSVLAGEVPDLYVGFLDSIEAWWANSTDLPLHEWLGLTRLDYYRIRKHPSSIASVFRELKLSSDPNYKPIVQTIVASYMSTGEPVMVDEIERATGLRSTEITATLHAIAACDLAPVESTCSAAWMMVPTRSHLRTMITEKSS